MIFISLKTIFAHLTSISTESTSTESTSTTTTTTTTTTTFPASNGIDGVVFEYLKQKYLVLSVTPKPRLGSL